MFKKASIVLILVTALICAAAQICGAGSSAERVVLATLYFSTDSAEIKPDFEKELKDILAALEADSAMGLRLEGHSRQQDASGEHRKLSQERIMAVKQWFSKKGIANSRLTIKHFDNYKPASPTGQIKDPAHSERVEILRISLKQPVAYLPAPLYQFDTVPEGQVVTHDFIVQNRGSARLDIQRVKTD